MSPDAPEGPAEPAAESSAEPPIQPVADQSAQHDDAGLDLARTLSRATARSSPARRTAARRTDRPRTPGRVSGAHPDDRDPQTLDTALTRMVDDRGWQVDLRVAAMFARWGELVGPEVGAHSRAESFADGRLVVRTDSTAWATQLKLLAPSVVRRLNEDLGHGTVQVIEVLGPHAPSWKHGQRSVRDGRGPRDTYG